MSELGDYDITKYKTWVADPKDYPKKGTFIREHFNEITNGEAILVVNDEKHGQPCYIGPNVLMEMSLAFYQKKPIYLLNNPPNSSAFMEEVMAMGPISLDGDISKRSTYI